MTTEQELGSTSEEKSKVTNPAQVILPPSPLVCQNVKALLSNRKSRLDELTETLSQDPILIIELLKVVNSVSMSATRGQTLAVSKAIIALGSEQLSELVSSIAARSKMYPPNVAEIYDIQRERCIKTGNVARIIASKKASHLVSAAHTAGTLFSIGDMVAVAFLKETYLKLFEELEARSKVMYRLVQDFDFDIEEVAVKYLAYNGVPEEVTGILKRTGANLSADAVQVKTICCAAAEMLEAFEAGKWEKLAPDKKLTSKSSLRMLQLSERDYASVYEDVGAYLNPHNDTSKPDVSVVDAEEQQVLIAELSVASELGLSASTVGDNAGLAAKSKSEASSQDKAQESSTDFNIEESEQEYDTSTTDSGSDDQEDQSEATYSEPKQSEQRASSDLKRSPSQKIDSAAISSPAINPLGGFAETLKQLGLDKPRTLTTPSEALRVEAENEAIELAELCESGTPFTVAELKAQLSSSVVEKTEQFLKLLENSIEDVESCQELVDQVMQLLISEGPFKSTALLILDKANRKAKVVSTAGASSKKLTEIQIDEQGISSLLKSGFKVQSVGHGESRYSPFASSTYALAALDPIEKQQALLYADSGKFGVIHLASRRIFRKVVQIVNQKLKDLPGAFSSEEL
jgi:HD-like signal output (HDOD) protein